MVPAIKELTVESGSPAYGHTNKIVLLQHCFYTPNRRQEKDEAQ